MDLGSIYIERVIAQAPRLVTTRQHANHSAQFWRKVDVLTPKMEFPTFMSLILDSSKLTYLDTLLLRLKEDVMKQMDPTQQPYSEELTMGKITFKAWDLGGHEAARKTWRNYVSDVDGIIYLVDSSNTKRFEESRVEL